MSGRPPRRSPRGRPERTPRREPPPNLPLAVRIDAIAAGGEGVGRLEDGRVVFAHRTAPGELVEITLTEQRARWARWARGRLLRVLEPAPARTEAPCRFYAECGGCTLEHLQYPAQLDAKARIVHDALTRIGRLEVPVPEVIGSPHEFRYRNRVSFALRRLGAGRVLAGFHALADANRIVDLDGACLLPEEPIARVWDALRQSWGPDARLLPSGERLRLTLRASAAGEVSLLVEGGYSPGEPGALLDAVPGLASIWHRPGEGGQAAAALVAGAPGLPDVWGDETVELSGAAFLQVNRAAASLLEAHVLEVVGEVAGRRVVDAYCGIGMHARRLARAGAAVIGIELDPQAVAEARRRAPNGADFREGPVELLLPDALPADLLILNPPRAGVAPEVTDAIAAAPPQRIVYVSCNPATLARDLARLGDRFRVQSLRCFDLFPQTAHVETVVELMSIRHSAFGIQGSPDSQAPSPPES